MAFGTYLLTFPGSACWSRFSLFSSCRFSFLNLILVSFLQLRMVSWNVLGLNNKCKRAPMLKYLNAHKPHILFLQRTHLLGSKILSLRRAWVRQAFHATYSSYAREVTILLNKSLPYKVISVSIDPGGVIYYPVVRCKLCTPSSH